MLTRKMISGIMSIFLIVGLLTVMSNIPAVRATIWYVDAKGGGDFTKIQDAINDVSVHSGDTIYVYDGTYGENLRVNKAVMLVGESNSGTVIDGGGSGVVVNVTADGVTVESFSITGSGALYPNSGVFLNNVENSRVADNDVSYNDGQGILVYGLDAKATLANNTVSHNQGNGIFLNHASHVLIEGNSVSNNIGNGTRASGGSESIAIRHNSVASNGEAGIACQNCNYTSIVENDIADNLQDGIYLWSSHSIVVGNNVTRNGDDFWNGLFLTYCMDDRIYHNNFVDNGKSPQAEQFLGCSNIAWNDAYPSGGNYWNDYVDQDSHKGVYQNVTGSDAIWDHSYVVDGSDQDQYPLVNQWSIPQADAYLAVRGAHNEIWYRGCSSYAKSWGVWKALPNGATIDSPAAAVFSQNLYFVVLGADGQSLWFSHVNVTDDAFSGWTRLSGGTLSAPTLVSYGSKLILVVRGVTNVIWYRSYDCVSEVWGEWAAVPSGATCDRPAAAVVDTNLHLVVRGFSKTQISGNLTLWHCWINLTDSSFSGWTALPGGTPSAPTLAASQILNSIYLSVRGTNNAIWTNTRDDAGWQGWTMVPNGATLDSQGVAVANDELHLVVRSFAGTALWNYYISVFTDAPSGWIAMDGYTPSVPTLTG